MPRKFKSPTTLAVLKSRARKTEGKQEHERFLSAQAGLLGISVSELVQQKALEAETAREQGERNKIVCNVGPPVEKGEGADVLPWERKFPFS